MQKTTPNNRPWPWRFAINGLLASVALVYVLRLSAGDRGPVDWVVIGLVIAAMGYNLVRLGMGLRRSFRRQDPIVHK